MDKWLQYIRFGIACIIIFGFLRIDLHAMQVQNHQKYKVNEISYATMLDQSEDFYKADFDTEISVEVDGLMMEEALKEIAGITGLKLTYRGDIMKQKTVTLVNNKISVSDALDHILQETRLDYMFSRDGYLFIYKSEEDLMEMQAQEEISGTVTDAQSGEALPGVNILIKGTATGTSTDINGEYELIVSSPQDTLVFSYIGYQTQEVPIDRRTGIDIALKPEVISREDEIVVVGYGEQEAVSVTGSISSIEAEDIQHVPTTSISHTLGGRLPGIVTRQSSGEPGYDNAQVLIRGLGTWVNRDPLILVDGVQRDLDDINVEAVDNVSVLKDASATAVYGVRGANGVILIETKRGNQGKPRITFRTEGASLKPLRLPNYVSGAEYAGLMNEALSNVDKSPVYTEEELQKFRTGSSPYLYPSVDWVDEIVKDRTYQTRNNLSVNGGNDIVRYYVNLGYSVENGIYKQNNSYDYSTNANAKRYNFRSNVDLDLTENLIIKLGIGGIIRHNNFPGSSAGSIFNSLKIISPIEYPKTNPDGSIAGGASYLGQNPWAIVTQSGYRRQDFNTVQGTFSAEWDLSSRVTKGLSVKGKYAYDHYDATYNDRNRVYPIKRYTGKDPETGEDTYQTIREGAPQTYNINTAANQLQYYEASIKYDRDFNTHSLSGLLLLNQQEYINLHAGSSEANLPFRDRGLAGRLTYGYDDRYFAEFNVGYNGSENFPEGERFGLFPSGSVGWNVSNEDFWNIGFINHLKLRGSYGQVGNDEIGGGRFLYLTRINPGGGYRFGTDQRWYQAFQENLIGNDDVSWEVATKADVGLDLEMFDGHISLQADYFREHRDGILIQRGTVPEYSGYAGGTLPYGNIGEAKNRGVDALLQIRNNTRTGIFYSMKASFTFAQSEVVENDEPPQRYEYQSAVGHPIDQPFGLVALGLFEDEQEIEEHATQTFMETVRPGDIKYKDQNGDGVIDSFDEVPIGHPRTPEIMFGFGGAISYKGWEASVYFNGAARTSTFLDYQSMFPFQLGFGSYNILHEYYDNRWTPQNKDAKYPAVIDGTSANNYRTSTLYMKDASYIRLKTAQIAYNIPTDGLGGIRELKIFVNGENLYTWDKINVINPESNYGTGGYPIQQKKNVGIEAKF